MILSYPKRISNGRPKIRATDSLKGDLGRKLVQSIVTHLESADRLLNMVDVVGELLLATRQRREGK